MPNVSRIFIPTFPKLFFLGLFVGSAVIPNPENNVLFEQRESCRQIVDRKWHSIKSIQCHLRSAIFDALTRSNRTLFPGFGIPYKIFPSQHSARAMSPTDFEKGSELIDREKYHDFSRARGGNTPVYLPPDLPIVLKCCGARGNCKERLSKIVEAREILKSIGATRLIIPQARAHGDFLIEERIPFSSIDTLEQMGLYVNNKEKFTQAIRELTALFCQARLSDLALSSYWVSSSHMHKDSPHLVNSVIPRFDNMPLYIEGGKGKIGLIDLESFSSAPSNGPTDSYWSISHWSKLISFFPYHATDILDVVERMKLSGSFHESSPLSQSELNQLHKTALATYERAYIGHQNFLTENGIRAETASQFQINPEKLEAIKKSLKNDFANGLLSRISVRHNSPLKTFSSWPSDEEKKKMNHFIDLMIPEAAKLLQKKLEIPLSICKESNQDLVRCRSLPLDYEDDLYKYLTTKLNPLFPQRRKDLTERSKWTPLGSQEDC